MAPAAPDALRFELTDTSAPLLGTLIGQISAAHRHATQSLRIGGPTVAPPLSRPAPCRFASVSLGKWGSRLPKFTSRGLTWDPWDAASQEAPQGIRRGVQTADQPPADALRPVTEPDAACTAAGAATAAATAVTGTAQRAKQQQARPSDDGALLQEAALDVEQPGRWRRQQTRQRPDGEPWTFPEWLAQRLQRLPGGPELRQSLPLWLVLSPPGAPDKRRLMTVQDFFKYTETEGRDFFKELDRDGDGRITADDVRSALRRRNLPDKLAGDFIRSARGNRWWSNSIGWEEFQAVVEEREPKILRTFTAMEVDASGQLKTSQIRDTLTRLGVPATEETAQAMIRTLGAEEDGAVSYGRYRRFAILLPPERLTAVDPGAAWFEAATMMPLGPPAATTEQGPNYLAVLAKAALAGGLASSVSVLLLHPIDTLKTRAQVRLVLHNSRPALLKATPGATLRGIAAAAPKIGVRGLYRGIIPAVGGTFVGHGARTLSYEAAAAGLGKLLGGAAELQVQGLASGVGTVLGTCIRIPCEVLKQRLQVGRHANVVEAARAATAVGGGGLFRGTTALLSREVPFYALGMVGYQSLKKVANGSAWGGRPRELAPWQTIVIGAAAGAFASLATMPADVLKTRIMTSAAGGPAPSAGALLVAIVRTEGVLALWQGAIPRAIWVAPAGAMNFAGYELAKRALAGPQPQTEGGGGGSCGGSGRRETGAEQRELVSAGAT